MESMVNAAPGAAVDHGSPPLQSGLDQEQQFGLPLGQCSDGGR